MTKAGVNVVLGTDSRASNPDLDIWNEVRTLRSTYREVSPQFAFAAVTQRAAEALGCQDRYGTLQVGKRAAINVADYDPIASQDNLLDELTLRANPFEPLHQYLSLAMR